MVMRAKPGLKVVQNPFMSTHIMYSLWALGEYYFEKQPRPPPRLQESALHQFNSTQGKCNICTQYTGETAAAKTIALSQPLHTCGAQVLGVL